MKPSESHTLRGRQYRLQAWGWALEATAHRLTEDDLKVLEAWGGDVGEVGNLEGVLPEYNCYFTNLWQSGCVPSAENNVFSLLDEKGRVVWEGLSIGSPSGEAQRAEGVGGILGVDPVDGKVLIYCEESKGLTATWIVFSDTVPMFRDFSFHISKVIIGGEAFEYIEGVSYLGQSLERDCDEEDLSGKAAYSLLV